MDQTKYLEDDINDIQNQLENLKQKRDEVNLVVEDQIKIVQADIEQNLFKNQNKNNENPQLKPIDQEKKQHEVTQGFGQTDEPNIFKTFNQEALSSIEQRESTTKKLLQEMMDVQVPQFDFTEQASKERQNTDPLQRNQQDKNEEQKQILDEQIKSNYCTQEQINQAKEEENILNQKVIALKNQIEQLYQDHDDIVTKIKNAEDLKYELLQNLQIQIDQIEIIKQQPNLHDDQDNQSRSSRSSLVRIKLQDLQQRSEQVKADINSSSDSIKQQIVEQKLDDEIKILLKQKLEDALDTQSICDDLILRINKINDLRVDLQIQEESLLNNIPILELSIKEAQEYNNILGTRKQYFLDQKDNLEIELNHAEQKYDNLQKKYYEIQDSQNKLRDSVDELVQQRNIQQIKLPETVIMSPQQQNVSAEIRQIIEEEVKEIPKEIKELQSGIPPSMEDLSILQENLRQGNTIVDSLIEQINQVEDLRVELEMKLEKLRNDVRRQKRTLESLNDERKDDEEDFYFLGTSTQNEDRVIKAKSREAGFSTQNEERVIKAKSREAGFQKVYTDNLDLKNQLDFLELSSAQLQTKVDQKRLKYETLKEQLLSLEVDNYGLAEAVYEREEGLDENTINQISVARIISKQNLDIPNEEQQQIKEVYLSLQQLEQCLSDLEAERRKREALVERLKAENSDLESLIKQLREKQEEQSQEAVELQSGGLECLGLEMQAEKRLLAEQLVKGNLELSGQVSQLQHEQNTLKRQKRNMEALIVDIQVVIKNRKEDQQRVAQENTQSGLRSKKMKNTRDANYKQQSGIEERLTLQQSQINELDQQIALQDGEITEAVECYTKLKEQFQEQDTKNQQQLTQLNNLKTENEVIDTELQNQQIYNQEQTQQLNIIQQNNQELEKELILYRQLIQDTSALENKTQELKQGIEEMQNNIVQLEETLTDSKEQCELIEPQLQYTREIYQNTREQYQQIIKEHSELEEKFQQEKGIYEELQEKMKQIEELSQSRNDLDQQQQNVLEHHNQLQISLTALNEEIPLLEQQICHLVLQKQEIGDRHSDLINQIKQFEEALKDDTIVQVQLEEQYSRMMVQFSGETERNQLIQVELAVIHEQLTKHEEQLSQVQSHHDIVQEKMQQLVAETNNDSYFIAELQKQKEQMSLRLSELEVDNIRDSKLIEVLLEQKEPQDIKLTELKRQSQALIQEFDGLQVEIQRIQVELKPRQILDEQNKAELVNLNSLQGHFERQNSELREQVKQSERDNNMLQMKIAELSSESKVLKRELNDNQIKLEKLRLKSIASEAVMIEEEQQVASLSEKEEYLKKKFKQIESSNEELKGSVKDMLIQRKALQTELQESQQKIEEIKNSTFVSEHQCTLIYEEVQQQEDHLRQAQLTLSNIQEEVANTTQQFMSLQHDLGEVEAVIAVKQRELKGTEQRKHTLLLKLEAANQELESVSKQIHNIRNQRVAEDDSDEEFMGGRASTHNDLNTKMTFLDQRKRGLLQDLNNLVDERQHELEEYEQLEAQSMLEEDIKMKEKRIGILERTVEQLQNQQMHNSEYLKLGQSMQVSRVSQPSFFMDENPILMDMQDQFNKERDLLNELQNKIRETAQRHHDLAKSLQDYAEKESRMAEELSYRQTIIEAIENDLQMVANRQFDLESDRAINLQKVQVLEKERDETLEEENRLKTKIKDKRDYVQQLVKVLLEMDEKLIQLRNKLQQYAEEVSNLSQQVRNLEDEKNEKRRFLKLLDSQNEELRNQATERQEEKKRIQAFIDESQQESRSLEENCVGLQRMIIDKKQQLGFDETLYLRIRQECERMMRHGEVNIKNLFKSTTSQTEYEIHQLTELGKISDQFMSGQQTAQQVASLMQRNSQQLRIARSQLTSKLLTDCPALGTLIQAQEVQIALLETEITLCNEKLLNTKIPRLLSQSGFVGPNALPPQLNDVPSSFEYEFDQVVFGLDKSVPVKVILETQVSHFQMTLGTNPVEKITQIQILDLIFEHDNVAYPLGLLIIIYNVIIWIFYNRQIIVKSTLFRQLVLG